LFGNRSGPAYNHQAMELTSQAGSRRIIGILGGMGPEATLDLFRCIIDLTPARRDQDHIQVLIYSNPKIPDRTKAIAAGGESPIPQLVESALLLEKSGAGILAMPCNAAHHYLPEVRQRVHIPFLDMIEETSRRLRSLLPCVKKVGLIASIGTYCSGVYPRSLSAVGVETVIPAHSDQQRIEAAINEVKAGRHGRAAQETFQSVGGRLIESGAEAVILGCTEIPLAFDVREVNYPTLNPTKILAEAAVEWALKKESATLSA
jgi:aspartate racemase